MPKTKLSCCDQSVWVLFVIKTKLYNNVADHVGLLYAKNKIKNWVTMIDQTGYGLRWKPKWKTTWSIVQVRSMPKMKLSYHELSDQVWFVTKTRQNKDVIDHTSTVYVENETELSWSIRPGAIYYENEIEQWRDWSYKTMMGLIVEVRSILKMKLSFRDL